MIRYKLKPDQVAQYLEGLRAIYAEFESAQPGWLRQATFQLEDKVSFVIFTELDDPGRLADMPAFQRARSTLEGSGFDIEVRVYSPDVAGSTAGDQLANGLREATLGGHDIVLLLRQDGRPLSLAPYDSEAVVRAVATSTTPVLSGLGSRSR